MLYYRASQAKDGAAALRPRRVRWLTGVTLMSYPVGAALTLNGHAAASPAIQIAGFALMLAAILSCLGFIGGGLQRITGEVAQALDERELELRRRAYAFAYQTFGALTLIGVIYLAIASDAQSKLPWLWIPQGYDQWNALFWGVFLYLFTLPTAWLAWTIQPLDE